MPTRSYILPADLSHLEKILEVEGEVCAWPDGQGFGENDIPPISSPGIISVLLGVSPKIIFSIKTRRSKYYRTFKIPKKTKGEYREIKAPRTYLKVIQWWILDNILSRVEISQNAFGFVRGKSAVANAELHTGSNHLLNVDIRDFFPSISESAVAEAFASLGYSGDVSDHLAALCSLDEKLPQGAPTSPALANIVCREMDRELSELANSRGMKYSRYADDLTFSSLDFIEHGFITSIEKEIQRYGFKLNARKSRFSGRGDQMEVTGAVVNVHPQPPRHWRKNTRAALHNMTKRSRLVRRDLNYLLGVVGMSGAYPRSPQIQTLAETARALMEARKGEVIGIGGSPKLPNGLTLLQAEALAKLGKGLSNADLATILGTSEAAVKKRLQLAFRKIGRSNRQQARLWAEKNL